MKNAHNYIEKHFDTLKNFEVIDIEYIFNLSDKKKVSEIIND